MLPSDKFNSILRDLGHTRTSFARRMGLRPEQLSRYFPPDGKRPMRPGMATVLRIIAASRGRISLNDLQPASAPISPKRCPFCGGEGYRAGEVAQAFAAFARHSVPAKARCESQKHTPEARRS
jgi:hypothetical protein